MKKIMILILLLFLLTGCENISYHGPEYCWVCEYFEGTGTYYAVNDSSTVVRTKKLIKCDYSKIEIEWLIEEYGLTPNIALNDTLFSHTWMECETIGDVINGPRE